MKKAAKKAGLRLKMKSLKIRRYRDLLKVCGLSDLDMSGAKGLKDLYDCRVCANHIAQVYMRGIMDAKDLKRDGGFLWFDLEGTDTEETNEAIIGRLVQISNS